MRVQNNSNHIRFYPPHHFVFYPFACVLAFIAGYKAAKDDGTVLFFMLALLIVLIALSYMMRQHYALTLQNRLVRLEMRHKYSMLTGKDFEPLEEKLSFKQIAALRFASDEELVPLVMKTVKEQLSPKIIKESIINWKPDHMRV